MRLDKYEGNHGFTLIEVITALFVLSIVIAIVYESFYTTHRVIRVIEERIDSHHRLWGTLNILSEDIRTAYISEKKGLTLFKGEKILEGSPLPFLSFTTFTPNRDIGIAGTPIVEYYLKDRKTLKSLIRRIVLKKKGGLAEEEEELLTGIRELDISYYKDGKLRDKWDSESSKGLPDGVVLKLSFQDIKITMTIPIEGR